MLNLSMMGSLGRRRSTSAQCGVVSSEWMRYSERMNVLILVRATAQDVESLRIADPNASEREREATCEGMLAHIRIIRKGRGLVNREGVFSHPAAAQQAWG